LISQKWVLKDIQGSKWIKTLKLRFQDNLFKKTKKALFVRGFFFDRTYPEFYY
jgi:hypothetical protein